MEENVLLTGGAGFIGSHLLEALIKRPDVDLVVVIDNLSMSDGQFINSLQSPKIRFFKDDVRNYELVSLLINRYSISTVFHLAVSPLIFSLKDPQVVTENIIGMQQVLLECQRKGFFKKLITFSTSEVYGSNEGLLLKETDRLSPRTPYAAAKAACDLLTQSYGESFRTDYTIIRPFNNYGPRKNVFQQQAGIIPSTIKKISRGKKIPVYGDGSYSRDFVFVTDTVSAVLLAWKCSDCFQEIINIATGYSHSVLDIINDIGVLMKTKPTIEFLPNRDGDISQLRGDGWKADNLLNFVPQTTWEDGLKKCISYYSA